MIRTYFFTWLQKTTAILFFIFSFSMFSQQIVEFSGELEGFYYTATIHYKIDCYMSEPYVPSELKVTLKGFTHKGKYYNEGDIKEYPFPMTAKGFLKIKAAVRIGVYGSVDLLYSNLAINYDNTDAIPHMKDDFRVSKEGKAYLKEQEIILCTDWIEKAIELRDIEVIGGHFESKSLGLASEIRSVIDKMIKTQDFESAIETGMLNVSWAALEDAKKAYKTALNTNPYTEHSIQQLANLKQAILNLEKEETSKKEEKKEETNVDTLEEDTSKTEKNEMWTSLDEPEKPTATKKETTSNKWATLDNNPSANSNISNNVSGDPTPNKEDALYQITSKDGLQGVIHPQTKKTLIPFRDWTILEYKPDENTAKVSKSMSPKRIIETVDCDLIYKIYVAIQEEGDVDVQGNWILNPVEVAFIMFNQYTFTNINDTTHTQKCRDRAISRTKEVIIDYESRGYKVIKGSRGL